jgi:RHS repeat-associated protein
MKYDPFGARVTAADPTVRITAPPQDLRAGFTGHDQDDDVNLIDMIGRVYDPVTQRFLSVDPPAPDPVDSQAYNPYAYVRNNPLNATDPTGYLEIRGSSLGLSPNAGAMWDSADTYLGWVSVTTYTIPYGCLPGEAQGASGQEGTGGGGWGDVSKIGVVDMSEAKFDRDEVQFAKFDPDDGGGGGEGAGGTGGGDGTGFQLGEFYLSQRLADHYSELLAELAAPPLPHHVDERPGQVSDQKASDMWPLMMLFPGGVAGFGLADGLELSASQSIVANFIKAGDALSEGNATIWGRMYMNAAGERRLLGAVTGGDGAGLTGAEIAGRLEASLAESGVNADVVAAARQNVLVHAERLGFRIETTLRAQGWTPIGNALTNRAACMCFGPGCSIAQAWTQTLVLH